MVIELTVSGVFLIHDSLVSVTSLLKVTYRFAAE
jgi:hypothetical protein